MNFYCEDGMEASDEEEREYRDTSLSMGFTDYGEEVFGCTESRNELFDHKNSDDKENDMMEVCVTPDTPRTDDVLEGEKRCPLKSCLKRGGSGRPKRRRILRFHPDVKTHDGLSPIHSLLDDIVWIYFKGEIKNVMNLIKVVPIDKLHLLAHIHPKLTIIMKECKKRGKTHILQGGGGHASSVTYDTHYESLARLRELVRVTHNRLHAGAVIAMKNELGPDKATDFVLEYVERKEAEAAYERLKRIPDDYRGRPLFAY